MNHWAFQLRRSGLSGGHGGWDVNYCTFALFVAGGGVTSVPYWINWSYHVLLLLTSILIFLVVGGNRQTQPRDLCSFRTPSFGGHASKEATVQPVLQAKRVCQNSGPAIVICHISWIHTSIMDPLELPAISRCPYFFDRVSFPVSETATRTDLLQLEMPEKINPIGQSQKHQGLIYPLVMRDSPFGMIGNLTSNIFFGSLSAIC